MTAGEGGTAARRASEAGGPWTVMRIIRYSTDWLRGKGVEEDARLQVERLLGDALGISRLDLYLQFDRPLVPGELAAFKERLLRRSRGEPVQYITGRAHFRELELRVDRRVLIPRPETEVLVQRILDWTREERRGEELEVLEIGTGSGAIGLSLAVEGPFDRIVATDVSEEALELARENLEACAPEATVDFRSGSLYASLAPEERFDVVVSNPPYVAEGEREDLPPEVREWEPDEALFSGPTGLELLEELVAGAPDRLRPGGLLALEMGLGQAGAVVERIGSTGAFAEAEVVEDLTGRDRVVVARRTG